MTDGSEPDALLIGYYGRENFGDDILFKVAHSILREHRPDARIGVLGSDAAYLDHLAGEPVSRVAYGPGKTYRIIVHGGGGTFFDFDPQLLSRKLRNFGLLAAGAKSFVAGERLLRKLIGKPSDRGSRRVGLGIGVGTYTAGSTRLLRALPTLSEFDLLWVRDPRSIENLDRLGLIVPTVLGSDLAFLHERWRPATLRVQPPRDDSARRRIAIILRDWPRRGMAETAYRLRALLDDLKADFDFTLVSLNPAADAAVIETFRDFEVHQWSPESEPLDAFLGHVVGHDAVLSSRAHGAICGACLGLPTLILPIEPKLRAVHALLPRASRLFDGPFTSNALRDALRDTLAISEADIAADVQQNRAASLAALAQMQPLLAP
jgi:polysaccharide pyruvyl transferase WcaK-like protein